MWPFRKRQPTPVPATEVIKAPDLPAKRALPLGAVSLQRALYAKQMLPTTYMIPARPPGVGPRGNHTAKLAMDEDVAEILSWANQQALGSFWAEGLTFPGYAYLSELAQRPEYRVISETIATEMTREWIQFIAKDDNEDEQPDDEDSSDDDGRSKFPDAPSSGFNAGNKFSSAKQPAMDLGLPPPPKPAKTEQDDDVELSALDPADDPEGIGAEAPSPEDIASQMEEIAQKAKKARQTKRIAELEAEFKRLNVRDLMARAVQQDGYFGRGHIYIDTGDTDDTVELDKPIGDGWDPVSEVKMASKRIRALRTVEALWCYPTSYNSNDPLKDDWYRPNSWYVQAKVVHSSRLITLIGREVPDLLKPTYSFGGLSLSQMAKPYVDNWLETRQSVNDLIKSFTTYVLSTNLGESLQADGDELFKRLQLFNNTRTNSGVMAIDKDTEEFTNVSQPLGGLHELQAQAQEHMASVSHIPTVKLLGIQPSGLNADSDGVMRAFYDWIHAYQEHLLRKPIHRLMGYVMLSLWGETDDSIDFEFAPLWSLDEKSAADVNKTKADMDTALIDRGVIGPEESRKRLASDPHSEYSWIDPDDMPDLASEEAEGLEPMGGRPDDAAKGDDEDAEGGSPGAPTPPPSAGRGRRAPKEPSGATA